MPRAKLNPLEAQAYQYIVDFQKQHHARPPYSLMSKALGCNYHMARLLINQLAAKGWIQIEYNEHGRMKQSAQYEIIEVQS